MSLLFTAHVYCMHLNNKRLSNFHLNFYIISIRKVTGLYNISVLSLALKRKTVPVVSYMKNFLHFHIKIAYMLSVYTRFSLNHHANLINRLRVECVLVHGVARVNVISETNWIWTKNTKPKSWKLNWIDVCVCGCNVDTWNCTK